MGRVSVPLLLLAIVLWLAFFIWPWLGQWMIVRYPAEVGDYLRQTLNVQIFLLMCGAVVFTVLAVVRGRRYG